MTAYRRTARALTLGAGGSAGANRYYAAHHRQVAEARWEQQHVLGKRPAPLNPCCMLARHSEGAAHDGRRCTNEFHRITAHLDAEPRSST